MNGRFSSVRGLIPTEPIHLPPHSVSPSLLSFYLFSLHTCLLFWSRDGFQVMGARALLALVVAAGAAKSVWSAVSNHADKRGALRQEDEALCRASAGVDYTSMWHLTIRAGETRYGYLCPQ